MSQKQIGSPFVNNQIGNELLYESSCFPEAGIIVIHEDSLFLSGEMLEKAEQKLKEIGITLIRERTYICG